MHHKEPHQKKVLLEDVVSKAIAKEGQHYNEWNYYTVLREKHTIY